MLSLLNSLKIGNFITFFYNFILNIIYYYNFIKNNSCLSYNLKIKFLENFILVTKINIKYNK